MTTHTPRALHAVAHDLGISAVADGLALPVLEDAGYHLLMTGGSRMEPSMRWSCRHYRLRSQHIGAAVRTAPSLPLSVLAGYAEESFCPDCTEVPGLQNFSYFASSNGVSMTAQRGAQAIELARVEYDRRSLQRKDGKPSKSANVIQRQRDQLEDAVRSLATLHAQMQPQPTGELREAFVEVEDRVRGDLQRLKGLQRGADLTERLHKQIRTAAGLQPEWAVDATPTLVGFSPYRGSNRLVRAIVESAKISETKQSVVVRVPAWVGHFLLHTDRSQRVQAVTAPDEALARTAALLWDPTQEGPLGSLAGALEVAAEIEQ